MSPENLFIYKAKLQKIRFYVKDMKLVDCPILSLISLIKQLLSST